MVDCMEPAGVAEAGETLREAPPTEHTTLQAWRTRLGLRAIAAREDGGMEMKAQAPVRNEAPHPHVDREPVDTKIAMRSRL